MDPSEYPVPGADGDPDSGRELSAGLKVTTRGQVTGPSSRCKNHLRSWEGWMAEWLKKQSP
jgi:hypothetical protein